jgi:hypothetical protein
MPVNTGLADVSNDFLLAAVVIYALAMLAFACDFAFGKRPVKAAAAARVPALVGAAAGSGESPASNAPSAAPPS